MDERDTAHACPGEDAIACFVDGALAPAEVAAIERHIDGCASCCALLASLGRAQASEPTLTPEGDASDAVELHRGAAVGRYVLLERVGSGGMGVVWAAFDPQLDRRIAIKLLRPERAGERGAQGRVRLLREAQSMARLSHPNVVAVHDVGMVGENDDAIVFVAMEFVDGGTLGAWMREQAHPWPDVIARFVAAGRGLAAAHAEGIVHRDFKPDNVLVGRDGRVRVTDFGLAHAHARAPSLGDAELVASDDALERLTRTGAFLGTPAYMAPEQFAGGPSDARSDQFSFCIALWEALYGARPFAGRSIGELAAAVGDGRVREPTGARVRVPAPIDAALRRGLAVAPDDRFPDMASLLAVLARDRDAWRSRSTAVALGLALVGVVAWGAVRSPAAAAPCTAAAARMAEVWSTARASEVRDALIATGVVYAEPTAASLEARLDAYAGDWIAMHTDACEATAVRGEQSAELLDRRMACLDERRHELAALVDALARADGTVVPQAVTAAAALRPLDRCADAEALAAELPPPEDPELAARVEALDASKRKLVAQSRTGHEREALDGLEALAQEAAALGWPPLAVEVNAILGRSRVAMGEHDEGVRVLTEAYETALEIGHDEIAAQAAIDLVFVVGTKLLRHDEGKAWARHALALARRVGRDDLVEADALDEVGMLMLHTGDVERAARDIGAGLAILERRLGPDDVTTAQTRGRLADVRVAQLEFATAEREYLRTIAAIETSLGEGHPMLSAPCANLGGLYYRMNRLDDAERSFERARAIQEAAFGAAHGDLVVTLTNLGNVALSRRDWVRARASYERARDIAIAAFGEDSSQVGIALVNLGAVLRELGDLEGSRRAYERTIALWERDMGADATVLAFPLAGLGHTLMDLGLVDDAVPVVERAVQLRAKAPVAASERADSDLAHARMLWLTGRDRARARAIAEELRAALGAETTPAVEILAQVDRWLADHPAPTKRPR